MKHLSQLGYGYLEAENAKAALEILDQGIDIDLLFTDIVMPGGMSGYDLDREAVARRPNLKVLMTPGFPGAALSNSKRSEEHKSELQSLLRTESNGICVPTQIPQN